MSTADRDQIFIIIENESDCPQNLLEGLKNAGFQIAVQVADPTAGLTDNLSAASKQASEMRRTGNRTGILGIGYGGAVAGHLLAESDEFFAVVLIGALLNPATAYGTGTGIHFPGTGEKFCMLEYLSKLSDESVVRYCDAIHTPILFLHGLQDTVYGFEQSEQLFTALKERQPDSKLRMVVFPTAGHELLKGNEAFRCEKEIVSWFTDRRVGGECCE